YPIYSLIHRISVRRSVIPAKAETDHAAGPRAGPEQTAVFQRKRKDQNERKSFAFHAGQVRCGYTFQSASGGGTDRCAPVSVSHKERCGNGVLSAWMGPDHLLLFQDIFKKCV